MAHNKRSHVQQSAAEKWSGGHPAKITSDGGMGKGGGIHG